MVLAERCSTYYGREVIF